MRTARSPVRVAAMRIGGGLESLDAALVDDRGAGGDDLRAAGRARGAQPALLGGLRMRNGRGGREGRRQGEADDSNEFSAHNDRSTMDYPGAGRFGGLRTQNLARSVANESMSGGIAGVKINPARAKGAPH